MDPDTQVHSILRRGGQVEDEEREKWKRPPSSYGSMRSDSDSMEHEDGEGSEEAVAVLPESAAPVGTGLQLIRSQSPETLYTMTTEQTKPPGALVIETRSSDLGDFPEDDEEEEEVEDELLIATSPEPPEPVEPEDTMQTDENRLHPEQDIPHIFKSIQNVLAGLTKEDLYKFKMSFYKAEQGMTLQQIMEGDLLDFVDRSLEIFGAEDSLLNIIRCLQAVNKKEEAEKLKTQCNRAMVCFYIKQTIVRECQIIHEGVVRAGKQDYLNNIFVEPQISTAGYGGVDPSHEFRPGPPSPIQVPSADTFVRLNDLFRLQKEDGTPVRTVVTTGIPGIGLSVCASKFSLDWAEKVANKDLQFVIRLSLKVLWSLRSRNFTSPLSALELATCLLHRSHDMSFLAEEDCKFLVIFDSFDCYQESLDWENAPVITDDKTEAHLDVLIVNIIRGTVLRGAQVWILGRRAAVSQIPSQYIDVVTEIQGFSDEMKDQYHTKRFSTPGLGANIVTHYKRVPSLIILARNPFVSWMVATVFERCYRYQGYGEHPPRLTPFYCNLLIVQMNRRLQFYYGNTDNYLKWSNDDRFLVTKMGKMAFKMLERNTSVFFEEDVKECGLKLTEVVVFSGVCTELPAPAPDGRKVFCFIHFTFQEFMAALYVFTIFRTEAKNILDSGLLHMPKIFTSKSAADLLQCALLRTFNAPMGYYELFLRFLCGMLSTDCHDSQLGGYLYQHNAPKVVGLDEVPKLLQQTIQTAPEDRRENLKECLREMIQEDE